MRAFTLPELLIAMIISALIISMSYWSYLNMQSYFGSQRRKFDKLSSWLVFKKQFNQDLLNSSSLYLTKDELELKVSNQSKIRYSFVGSKVLRKKDSSLVDTVFSSEKVSFSWLVRPCSYSKIDSSLYINIIYEEDVNSTTIYFVKPLWYGINIGRADHL